MFDVNKPVQTRDGKPARIICTDKKGKFPIVALVSAYGEYEEPHTYRSNGCYWEGKEASGEDLINIPEETREYMNLYLSSKSIGVAYTSLAKAKEKGDADSVGILEIIKIDGKIKTFNLIEE